MRLILASESGVRKAIFTHPLMIKQMLRPDCGVWFKATLTNKQVVSRFKVTHAGSMDIKNGDVEILVTVNDRMYFVNDNYDHIEPPFGFM